MPSFEPGTSFTRQRLYQLSYGDYYTLDSHWGYCRVRRSLDVDSPSDDESDDEPEEEVLPIRLSLDSTPVSTARWRWSFVGSFFFQLFIGSFGCSRSRSRFPIRRRRWSRVLWGISGLLWLCLLSGYWIWETATFSVQWTKTQKITGVIFLIYAQNYSTL